jgi:general nucleoside transport system permease protein
MIRILKIFQPVLSVLLGLALGLLVVLVAGESPWNVLQILVRGAFGSRYDFGMTVFYATPLLLTGLSVAIAFQCGLFNIGAEGQLTLGALAAAAVGILLDDVPWPLAPLLAGTAAFATGAFWGAIPGWLRAKRGSRRFTCSGITNRRIQRPRLSRLRI